MKTVEEQVAELEVHRDQFIRGGLPNLADSVQATINTLQGTAPPQKKKRRSGDAEKLDKTAHEERYAGSSLSYGGQGYHMAGGFARTDPQSIHQIQHPKA